MDVSDDDRIGRRYALLIGVIICSGGIIGQILSATRVAFVISKLILGVGLGFYLTIGPLMTSEVLHSYLFDYSYADVQNR